MGQLGGEASADIDAPIEQVWDVVVDVASAPEWQEGFEAVEVVERDGDGRPLVANTESDAGVRTLKTRVRFTYEAPTLVEWRQEKGDLKSMVGAWELEDLGGGRTRATYRLDVDPGRMLGMLIRGPVETRLRDMLIGERPAELAARIGA
jgi:ribosome-associated toxin RatA of RatAB toxin-antitoxin module